MRIWALSLAFFNCCSFPCYAAIYGPLTYSDSGQSSASNARLGDFLTQRVSWPRSSDNDDSWNLTFSFGQPLHTDSGRVTLSLSDDNPSNADGSSLTITLVNGQPNRPPWELLPESLGAVRPATTPPVSRATRSRRSEDLADPADAQLTSASRSYLRRGPGMLSGSQTVVFAGETVLAEDGMHTPDFHNLPLDEEASAGATFAPFGDNLMLPAVAMPHATSPLAMSTETTSAGGADVSNSSINSEASGLINLLSLILACLAGLLWRSRSRTVA
jgi:hypothetical protein